MNEGYRKQVGSNYNYTQRSNQSSQFISTKDKFTPKSNTDVIQKAWIGQLSGAKKITEGKIQTPKHSQQNQSNSYKQTKPISYSRQSNQSPIGRFSNNISRASTAQKQQKTPTQLMNDIFRSIGFNHLLNQKTYYSKQSQDLLCELLSNKNKLNAYTKKIGQQMQQMPVDVQKNYQILLTLLQQLAEADLQVHQDENGMKLWFNRTELQEKQTEVERLERELEEKNKQTQKIVEQYQGVIRNFNDVIEKLVQEKKY